MKTINFLKNSAAALIIAAFALAGCEEDTVKVTGVSLNEQTLTLAVGNTRTLEETVEPADAANKSVTWTVTGDAITVDAEGTVTAVKAGDATVTVTTADGGKTASCTVKVNEKSAITVADGDKESLEQEVFADETAGESGVTFTTAGPWTSEIKYAAANTATVKAGGESDWLSISPDHGEAAGAYTIAISMEPNNTGEDRTATVTITCNGMDTEIKVTQKATKADGTLPEQPGRKIAFRVYTCNEWWAPDNGQEQHYPLADTAYTVLSIYKGGELYKSTDVFTGGVAEVMLPEGVYTYIVDNRGAKNIYGQEGQPGYILMGLWPNDRTGEMFRKLPGELMYRDVNGDALINAEDRVERVQLAVTEDATVDVYVAQGNFVPVYPWYYGQIQSMMTPTLNPYGILVQSSYYIDATLAHELNTDNAMYTYTHTAATPAVAPLWNRAYDVIRIANTVLELLPNVVADISSPEADETKARARYYRAYAYYTLLNYFGGAPLTDATNLPGCTTVDEPRSTGQETGNYIIADLDFAAEHYGNTHNLDIGNRWAAKQMKARVLRILGTSSVGLMEEIVHSGNFSLSTVWGADAVAPALNIYFIPPMQKGEMVYPVRYAEAMLLYAEASLISDEVQTAVQVANQFAVLQGQMPVFPNGGATVEEVRTEINRLWGTQLDREGLSFARLKRTGTFLTEMAQYGAQEKHLLLPIPQSALEANPNLTQNPGYE